MFEVLMDQMSLVQHVYYFWIGIKSRIQVFSEEPNIFEARVHASFVLEFFFICEPIQKLFEGL